jgi:hypothetical protein
MPWRRDHPLPQKISRQLCVVIRRFALALAFMLVFASARAVYSQCALGRTGSDAKNCGGPDDKQKVLPEDGFLASDSYTSRFFGFVIALPITSDGHRITIPVMLEKQHALLAIGFEQGKRFGRMVITAEESPKELPWYDDVQAERCPDATGPGSEPQHPAIPGFMLHFGSFYANQGHRGSYHVHHYWTRIKTYIIRVAVESNDQEFLKKAKEGLRKAQFYCTGVGGQLITKEGKVFVPPGEAYDGPTAPTWRVDAAITNKPGLGIPAGEVREGVYRNADLGLQYEFPSGWELVQVDISREPPQDERERREYELLHACSRTLLRVVQRGSGAPTQGARPSIILRALDPGCLAMRTPSSVDDKKTADEITANLELFSEFGEIKSRQLAFLGDKVFVIFHGIIGLRSPGEVLSNRMADTLFVTQHRQMLFLWYLMAPGSADLAAIPASSITFDNAQPITIPPAEGSR